MAAAVAGCGRRQPTATATPWPTCRPRASTEHLGGDGVEPALRVGRLRGALSARGRRRTDASGPRYLAQDAVDRLIDAGNADTIVGRHQAVTGVDQLWPRRRLARQQPDDRRRTDL